ncbi:MAG: hypothetical protein JXA21_25065 [Anaerolineae bacterium]|nr:hypothetical protein [Anaerolineae bacterium]
MMKATFSRNCSYVLILVFSILWASCTDSPIPSVSPTSNPELLTTTPIIITPSHTPALSTFTATPVPALSPTPSPVPPTHTRHPTLTPTAAPAPTLSPDEEKTLVLGMLQDNSGCQLPCWWGFTPGETPWQTVAAFLSAQGKQIWGYRYSDRTRYTVAFEVPQHLSLWQNYDVSNDRVDLIFIRAVPPTRDDEFVYGDTQFLKDLAPYTLSQMLTAYGQPVQILLGINAGAPWAPYELLFFYPEQGILMRYSGPAEYGERVFEVCPYRSEIAMWFWSPEHEITLGDFSNTDGYTAKIVAEIPSLEESTGITNEEFYQTFIQSGVEDCFETLFEVEP